MSNREALLRMAFAAGMVVAGLMLLAVGLFR
jgi:hypothetical protein